MEVALVVVGVPLGAALVAGIPLSFFSSRWLLRFGNGALAAQLALVPLAWLLLAAAPDENWSSSGSTCPDLDGAVGDLVVGIGFGSIAVGAVCLASAALTATRDRKSVV